MRKHGQMERNTWVNSCHDIGSTRFGGKVSCRNSMLTVALGTALVPGLRRKMGGMEEICGEPFGQL